MDPRYLTMQQQPQSAMDALSNSPINGLMTMLASKFPAVANYRDELGRRMSDLMANPSGFMRGAVNDVFPTMIEAEANLRRNRMAGSVMRDAPDAKDDALRQAYRDKLTNLGMAGLTVYHASPYKFDKFDSSKIGTGEGAQAYGHGLYYAENPKVVTAPNTNYAKNERIYKRASGGLSPIQENISDLIDSGLSVEQAFGKFSDAGKKVSQMTKVSPNESPFDAFRREYDAVKSLNTGHLYRVDLPDEHIAKMLDWDKPLSQQPQYVRDALNKSGLVKFEAPNTPVGSWLKSTTDPHNGAMDPSEMSRILREVGIPGIKYADQGSRPNQSVIDMLEQIISGLKSQNASPERIANFEKKLAETKVTRNFVVFDDALPKIIGKE